MKNFMTKKKYLTLLMPLLATITVQAGGLKALDDEQMSSQTGQALLNLSYIAPTDAANLESTRTGGEANMSFYKLGMEAEVELNANINKLQLGCGGVNGADACDIDIDNVSLSGLTDPTTGRAGTSALITNPFIEFAIKNPDSAALREMVGFRLSAEKLSGLLTLGTENSATPNGINTLSGYLKIQSGIGDTAAERSKIKGYASTDQQFMDAGVYQIEGRLVAIGAADVTFITNGGGFTFPEMDNLPFETEQIVVNGNRIESVSLTSSLDIPKIFLGSDYPATGTTTSNANGTTTAVYTAGNPVDAVVTGCRNTVFLLPACLAAPNGRELSNINMTGSIEGATANVNFEEALGFIHSLQVNSSASLSLQKQDVQWPGSETENIAQTGWWLAVQDPTDIGRVEPSERLSIEPLLGQFAARASDYLMENPATTNDLGGIFTGNGLDVDIDEIDLSDVTPLEMNLSNLQLNGQDFVPNCWGNLKFC